MHDVSGSGLKIRIVALPTFPAGFDITHFADDSDPWQVDELDITNTGFTLNGDMTRWSIPGGIAARVSVLPNTEEAENLQFLWDVNRVTTQKLSARDEITAVVSYADGKVETYTLGAMVSGPAGTGVSSDARLNTKTFGFMFERRV